MANPADLLHWVPSPNIRHRQRGKASCTQYLNLMPLDTSVSIYNYLGYLSLGPIFVLLVLIYPLR